MKPLFVRLLSLSRPLLAAVFAVTLALFAASPAGAVLINNGLAPPNPANVIGPGNSYPNESVVAANVGCQGQLCPSPGAPTTVALVAGGSVVSLAAQQTSSFTMTGGTASGGLGVSGSATGSMSGGAVTGGYEFTFFATDSGRIEFSGGTVLGDITAIDSSEVLMSGGTLTGSIRPRYSSSVTMSGGAVTDRVTVMDSASFKMSGGTVGFILEATDSSSVEISGGTVAVEIFGGRNAALTVIGSGFTVNQIPAPYGLVACVGGCSIAGILRSGEAISKSFTISDAATLTLIPEPSTSVLVLTGLLGIAARRRWCA